MSEPVNKQLLDALNANHQWHLDYDDYRQYMGSVLHTQNLDAIAAAEQALNARCEYCDGTGDVHRADGDWVGICTCPAGQAINAEPVDGQWYWVRREVFANEPREWVPAKRERNHWNSVSFSGAPPNDVEVGPAIVWNTQSPPPKLLGYDCMLKGYRGMTLEDAQEIERISDGPFKVVAIYEVSEK